MKASSVNRLMLTALSAAALIAYPACSGCHEDEPPPQKTPDADSVETEVSPKQLKAAEQTVLLLANELFHGNKAVMDDLIDWQKLEKNVRALKDQPKPDMTSEELLKHFKNGLVLAFKPGPGARLDAVTFQTRAKAVQNGHVRVFLFDGPKSRGGSINLTFLLAPQNEGWKIVYVDLYRYMKWAIFSSSDRRMEYRKAKIAEYE